MQDRVEIISILSQQQTSYSELENTTVQPHDSALHVQYLTKVRY